MSFDLTDTMAALRVRRPLRRLSRGSFGAATCGLGASLLLACASNQATSDSATGSPQTAAGATMQQPNTLSDAERRAGWRLLFDGTNLNAWRAYRGDAVPAAWRIEDGVIRKVVPTDDIVTRDQFGDFELTFDWKVATGGNAGVFYRATEEYDKVYWSATEYQLLDDPNHRDGQDPKTSAGAAYALYDAPRGAVKPAGEWNTARIVAKGAHVEHWLNGTKTAEYEAGSPDWEARVKGSKFASYTNYGRARRGVIALQGDHSGDLALRNIKIREIR
jgi:hypothetical protein